jgi:YD repeat-containing protein
LGSRIGNFLGGEEQSAMFRPYSLAVNENTLVVGDPGLGAVHIFGLKRKTYKKITVIGSISLTSPVGVALGDDRIYIADSVLNAVIILDERGRLINEVTDFHRPTSLAYDVNGQRLYVAETHAHRILILDRDANIIRSIGERGKGNGQFNFPTHIAVADNRLLVNDTMNFRLQVFNLDGEYLNQFGEHGDSVGYFAQSKGVAVDQLSHVYVAESIFSRIQIYSMDGQFLMSIGRFGEGAGEFHLPAGIATLGNRIFVADSGNGRIQVFDYIGVD